MKRRYIQDRKGETYS